jgi:hypothetical protein
LPVLYQKKEILAAEYHYRRECNGLSEVMIGSIAILGLRNKKRAYNQFYGLLLISVLLCTGAYFALGMSRTGLWYQNVQAVSESEFIESQTFGGPGRDVGNDISECGNGDIILIGSTESFGAGFSDMWVIRTDSTGSPIWNRTFGGLGYESGSSVIEHSTGGLVLGGDRQTPAEYPNFWIIHTNDAGQPLWNHTYGGTNGDFIPYVVECQDGGLAFVGTSFSFGAGEGDVWLIRTDTDGNVLWNVTFGGSANDCPNDIIECIDGGFAVIGTTESYSPQLYNGKAWVLRTNSSGHVLWNHTYGTSDYDMGRSIIERSGGGFAITGYSRDSDYYPEKIYAWARILNSSGVTLWQSLFSELHDYNGLSIVECSNGDFAIAGAIRYLGTNNWDLWITRINSSGDPVWERSLGGLAIDFGRQVIQRADGSFVIIGETESFGAGKFDIWQVFVPGDGGLIPPTSPPLPPYLPIIVLAVILCIVLIVIVILLRSRRGLSTK